MNPAKSEFPVKIHDIPENIIVFKGNIIELTEVDVLVNPVANFTTDLKSSGEVSKAFCEYGMEDLQKEYEKAGPPERFGTDVAVTGPAGAICCKKIFHPAIRGYRNEKSLELLKLMIEFCLKKAESLDMKSIAFPTIGCGRLGYDAIQVAKCFREAAKDANLQIYIVAFTDELHRTFSSVLEESARSSENLLQNRVSALVASFNAASTDHSKDNKPINYRKKMPSRFSSMRIHATSSDSTARNELRDLFEKFRVTPTSPDAIKKDHSRSSSKTLTRPIPPPKPSSRPSSTDGVVVELRRKVVGHLPVTSSDSTGRTELSDLFEKFRVTPTSPDAIKEDQSRSSSKTSTRPTPPPKPSFRPSSSNFNTDDTGAEPRRRVVGRRPVTTCDVEMPIFHHGLAELVPEVTNKIQALKSRGVKVHIEPDQSTVTLTGNREVLQEVKQRLLKILSEDELKRKNLDYIKTTKGVKEYLMALSQKNLTGFPVYWENSTFLNMSKSESRRCRLAKGSQLYDAVSAFVLNTWIPSLATYRRGARGLVHSNITIGNIWTIENPLLYTNYQFKLKALALKSAHKPFSSVSGLLGEQEIMTKQIKGVDYLNSQLIGELNEVYLFHGTSHVDEIIRNGIDSRFSGDRVLFGRGAYFAESSTKSDQYAAGAKLHLFVSRVLLGQPFICQQPRNDLKKAPCSTSGCHRDDCIDSSHVLCDSVVGTHTDANTRLLFREFIVYHPDQCYPEFLVEYERV